MSGREGYCSSSVSVLGPPVRLWAASALWGPTLRNTSLLRPFHTSTWQHSNESALDELEVEDDHSYEVERLLRWHYIGPNGKWTRRSKKEFLVLWRDYFIDHASWVLEDNFDYPKESPKTIERDQPIEDNTK